MLQPEELCGQYYCDPHTQNVINTHDSEKVHTEFYNFILGISNEVPNLEILAELGRFPLSVD